MALGRALKEETRCSPANERKVGARANTEKAATPKSKQYTTPKKTGTGPNYPQWQLGGGKPIGKL